MIINLYTVPGPATGESLIWGAVFLLLGLALFLPGVIQAISRAITDARADAQRCRDLDTERDRRAAERRNPTTTSVIHAAPPHGSGLMPCCGRTPIEAPGDDRMTYTLNFVTCPSWALARKADR